MTMNIVGFDSDVVSDNLLGLSIDLVYGLDGNDWFFHFLKFVLNSILSSQNRIPTPPPKKGAIVTKLNLKMF
jgi:hypothetical protein